jgi:hypothetical protein
MCKTSYVLLIQAGAELSVSTVYYNNYWVDFVNSTEIDFLK